MKTANELSALLGVCIVPQVVTRITPHFGGDEQRAIRELYLSKLYDRLCSPATGLWHLSADTLAGMFLAEARGETVEYPEEQA